MTAPRFSTDHQQLLHTLVATDHLLIIQDLDGVCMELVADPLQRTLSKSYLAAAKRLRDEFFVLTNGEHIGLRGVNGIVDRVIGDEKVAAGEGWYLPGLAAGGVQWQNRWGETAHPGVSERELTFLSEVSARCREFLNQWLIRHAGVSPSVAESCLHASVLDNTASPTLNLNTLFHSILASQPALCRSVQQDCEQFFRSMLQQAQIEGLGDSFFLHLAPNQGLSANGLEILKLADDDQSGTTDFQLMLTGARKEAGVLDLLNRYMFHHYGQWPLGPDFSVRTAPADGQGLLDLAMRRFDFERLPLMVAVGDTVTSNAIPGQTPLRGGSDRGFMTLVQNIGQNSPAGALTLLVDSSQGEVKRPGVDVSLLPAEDEPWRARHDSGVAGISDANDPLRVNYLFSQGSRQYCQFFEALAQQRCPG